MLSRCWHMAALLTIGILLLFYEVFDKVMILYYLILSEPQVQELFDHVLP